MPGGIRPLSSGLWARFGMKRTVPSPPHLELDLRNHTAGACEHRSRDCACDRLPAEGQLVAIRCHYRCAVGRCPGRACTLPLPEALDQLLGRLELLLRAQLTTGPAPRALRALACSLRAPAASLLQVAGRANSTGRHRRARTWPAWRRPPAPTATTATPQVPLTSINSDL